MSTSKESALFVAPIRNKAGVDAAADTVKIGLVQINNSFSGQNYLPYSIALLQTYVQKFAPDPGRYEFLTPLYKRVRIADAVEALKDADLVGFSTYVWNGRISLEIARRLKALKPGIVIVFGGPHVPDQPEAFLRANPPDRPRRPQRGRAHVPAAARGLARPRRLGGAARRQHGQGRRLASCATPTSTVCATSTRSPRRSSRARSTPSWRPIPTRAGSACGKPTAAARSAAPSATGARPPRPRSPSSARSGCSAKSTGSPRRRSSTSSAATPTSASRSATSTSPTTSPTSRRAPAIRWRCRCRTPRTPPSAPISTQKILSDAGLNKGVALSMQSVDMPTLEAIKRDNISLNTYMELQRRFTRDKVETYSDLILGLPGETYESFVKGVDQLMENGQHNRIQFNNLSILPNAEMGDPAYQKKYGMVTVESKIINIHGERVELDDDVPEVQDLVIATASTPLADWRRTRIFCWMTALLHFDKLFQIPLILAHGISGIAYRDMIEAFMVADPEALPDDRRDQRLLRERGPVDPEGRLGVRLLEGISQHLLAGRRVSSSSS